MVNKMNSTQLAIRLALAAVFSALVCVATLIFPIPIPATSGYFNFGETVIYIAALVFGPFVGAVAGGVGAAVADMLIGFSFFAPGTLVIKSLEGAIVGFLYKKLGSHASGRDLKAIIAMIIGGFEMVIGYFLYEQLILGYTTAATEIPFNIVQMLIGLAVAAPVSLIVFRVFPQLKSKN